MKTEIAEASTFNFLMGGGEMAARIRSFDWAGTPLGPIGQWPQSLKTSVSLILNTTHPMWIGWGPDVVFLYNDAYIEVLSKAKHPQALGKPCQEIWNEIWDICGPLISKVFRESESSFRYDVRFLMNRGDFTEETFYSFSYSPIRDESGNVGGLFCPTTDVTQKVLNARRLQTLSELAAKSLAEKSTVAACRSAAAILAKNPDDIPFALLYLLDADGGTARLEQAIGIPKGDGMISPEAVGLTGPDKGLWHLAEVMNSGVLQVVSIAGVEGFPIGPAEQAVSEAVILPVISGGHERPPAILVAGVNPARKLDADYRTFYDLLAGHVATAIQNARAAEAEKQRADKLAELDRAKTAFFSNVSHEFRTPLTLMLGPLEDLLSRKTSSPSAEEKTELEVVHRNSLRLLKLVNTLLDFSRIEAGRAQAVYVETDLAAFTADLASVFRSSMEKAGLQFIVDCPPLPQKVFVDHDMWEKVVFNLLSNAFKFTFTGTVTVSLGAGDDGAVLSVRDTGIGIPADELPNIFQRFHRIENARGRSHEGTGIGLALACELVKLHGGSLWAESAVGHGTVFRVKIPFGRNHLAVEHLSSPSHPKTTPSRGAAFREEASSWLPQMRQANLLDGDVGAGEFRKNGGSGTARPLILLADDNADMREYVERLLDKHYEVQSVADGMAALEAARKNPPNLVLSDVMMPRLDGFGLLRELRNDPATRVIPIILLSARAGDEAVVEGTQAGADDYLTKPFSARELLARVATHLKLARVRREAEEQMRTALVAREESEAKTRATLESITDGLHVVDSQARITYFNATGRRILAAHGHDAYALLGRNFFDVFPVVAQLPVGKAMKRCLTEHVPTEAENLYPPWQRWFSVRHYPTAEGGVSSFFLDITEQKQVEAEKQRGRELSEALNRINRLLHSTLEMGEIIQRLVGEGAQALGSDTAAVSLRKDGAWIVSHVHGMPADWIGRQMTDEVERHALRAIESRDIVAVADAFNDERFNREHFRKHHLGSVLVVPLIMRDQPFGVIFFNYHSAPHPFTDWEAGFARQLAASASIAMENARLFEERRQSEERERRLAAELRESRARFDFVTEAAELGFWFCNLPFEKLDWDAQTKEHFSLPPQARVTIDTFYAALHPEDRERTRQAIADSIGNRTRYDIEYRTLSAHGVQKWIRAIGRTFYDAGGEPRHFDGVTLDVTTRKRAEDALRDANALLSDKAAHLESLVQQRTAKLSETIQELEAFSYSIAHDMRAPLRSLQGFSRILLADHSSQLDAECQHYLNRIAVAAGRMDSLIQDVLNYSRVVRSEFPLDIVDVGQLVRGIIDTYPKMRPEEAEITVHGDLPSVYGNEAMLMQIFSNLLGNAVKFVGPGVKPRVRLWAETRKERVRFYVQDNGIGIPADQQEKIFGIFQRVSKDYDGTGIGLAIVKKAAARLGGSVGLESEPGRGSTFWVEVRKA